MNKSVLKSLKPKHSGPKLEKKKLVRQGLGQDFVFCSELGLKLSLLFWAGPKFLYLVWAEPGPEKSCSCQPVLESDKVKEKKHNHACVLGQSGDADSLFYFIA